MSAGLTVEQALHIMQRIAAMRADSHLVVPFEPGHATVGGAPCVRVTQITSGFDWNAGKVFLATEKPLGICGADLARHRVRTDAAYEAITWIKMTLNDKRTNDDFKVREISRCVERALKVAA